MPGLYLHIPFCKQACHYCNFHFSTRLVKKKEVLAAMELEIRLQKDYLAGAPLTSVYFGGGTPSLLTPEELHQLWSAINQHFSVLPDAEITLEANPDDLTISKLAALADSPVNRLSIGIQSFSDNDLRWMNRAHDEKEALECIKNAQQAGFHNLTIDLIYGSPTTSDQQWKKNIETAIELQIPHISCYCLTVEPRTALAHFVKKGQSKPVDEAQAARQFRILVNRLQASGYEHYEVSNFALPSFHARHNSSYWQREKYLGIGPAAHSYNGESRQWNVANNIKYYRSLLEQRLIPFEREWLTKEQHYNEYILTALRTKWGCRTTQLAAFGGDFLSFFIKKAEKYLNNGQMVKKENTYRLSTAGKLVADRIAVDLFWE